MYVCDKEKGGNERYMLNKGFMIASNWKNVFIHHLPQKHMHICRCLVMIGVAKEPTGMFLERHHLSKFLSL